MRKTVLECVALALAVAVAGCADNGPGPLSPTAVTPASTAAEGDPALKAGGPAIVSPASGSTLTNYRPTLVISAASATYVDVAFEYEFEVRSGSALVESGRVTDSDGGQVAYEMRTTLPPDEVFIWRARPSLAGVTGDWISATFRTQRPPALGASCASTSPQAIIACIRATFPEYLRGMPSNDEGRKHNMEFLRDRIIEAGVCGGLKFGWNMKRGGPEKSIDFLAWRDRNPDDPNRPGDADWGIDLAQDYDNNRPPLDLRWMPINPRAFFAEYTPAPVCQ